MFEQSRTGITKNESTSQPTQNNVRTTGHVWLTSSVDVHCKGISKIQAGKHNVTGSMVGDWMAVGFSGGTLFRIITYIISILPFLSFIKYID
jgi:hypothetical protein